MEMWGTPPQALTPVTVSCEFPAISAVGSPGSKNVLFSDTSMSFDPAHIVCRPPKTSLQSMWLSSGETSTWFTLNGPANVVVDVTFDFVLQNGEAAVTVTGATTSGIGIVGVRNLDGPAGSLTPVSYVNN